MMLLAEWILPDSTQINHKSQPPIPDFHLYLANFTGMPLKVTIEYWPDYAPRKEEEKIDYLPKGFV